MPEPTAIPKLKIFLSHSSQDKPLVRRLETALEAAGFEAWVDHDDLHAGESFPKRIGEAIAACDVLLLVWSQPASVSHWVEEEYNSALSLRKTIIPCILDHTPLPPLLRSISYANFREFESGLQQVLHALRTLSPQTSPPPITPPLSNMRDRRVDAAAPSAAEVGQRLDLLVQVRFPDSPLLGLEEWPAKKKPDHLEQTSESIALQFPIDPATGKLAPAKLEVQIIAPDFEIAGNARQRVLVPPEEYSKCLAFLITPKQTGACRINVEVYDIEQTFLGAFPLETNIGGAPVAQALHVANLMLFVVVGKEATAPPAKITEGEVGSPPPPSPAPPMPARPAASAGETISSEFPTDPTHSRHGYELPQSKASGCIKRMALWLGILASLATVLAFVFDLPEKFGWFTPARSRLFGEVYDTAGLPIEQAEVVLILGGSSFYARTDSKGAYSFLITLDRNEIVASMEIDHTDYKPYKAAVTLNKNSLKILDIHLQPQKRTRIKTESKSQQSKEASPATIPRIKGHVTDTEGNPLAFVEISVVARTESTNSDDHGNFTLIFEKDLSLSAVITIIGRKIGYKTARRNVVLGQTVELKMARTNE